MYLPPADVKTDAVKVSIFDKPELCGHNYIDSLSTLLSDLTAQLHIYIDVGREVCMSVLPRYCYCLAFTLCMYIHPIHTYWRCRQSGEWDLKHFLTRDFSSELWTLGDAYVNYAWLWPLNKLHPCIHHSWYLYFKFGLFKFDFSKVQDFTSYLMTMSAADPGRYLRFLETSYSQALGELVRIILLV